MNWDVICGCNFSWILRMDGILIGRKYWKGRDRVMSVCGGVGGEGCGVIFFLLCVDVEKLDK